MTSTPPALTPEQRAVVDAPSNARIAVLAVAGAGKTRVLVERALELIGRGAAAERLLFLSFTKDAQQELSRRLSANRSTEKCEVRTLHALARLQLGDIAIVSPDEEQSIKKSIQRRTSWRSREIDDFLQNYGQELTPKHRKLRQRIESKKCALSRQDGQKRILISELIVTALQHWQQHGHALAEVQGNFDYVIVDEYQDVNAQLHEFVTALAGPKPLTIVGDPHQAIFAFQGGDSRFLTDFADTADHAFTLDTCHRAPAQHVLLAESFLPAGTTFAPLRGFDGSLRIHEATYGDHAEDLLLEALTAIQERNDSENPGESNPPNNEKVAIIVESNEEARGLAKLLRTHHFSVRTTSEEQRPSRDAFIDDIFRLTIQTLAGKRERQLPLLKIAARLCPWGSIDPEDQLLLNVGWRTERPLNVLQMHCRGVGGRDLIAIWQKLLDVAENPVQQLPEGVARVFGAEKYSLSAALAICQGNSTIDQLLSHLDLERPAPESEILITTVHKAKGKEWRDVIVYDGLDQSKKHEAAHKKWMASEDMIIQESGSGSLGYVALTRSLENLTVILTNNGHGKFRGNRRTDQLQQLLTDVERTCSYPDELMEHYEAMPSFRRWIRESAAEHLPRADYHAVIHALQTTADPPALPGGWSDHDPPRLPPRVVRVPLRGKRGERA